MFRKHEFYRKQFIIEEWEREKVTYFPSRFTLNLTPQCGDRAYFPSSFPSIQRWTLNMISAPRCSTMYEREARARQVCLWGWDTHQGICLVNRSPEKQGNFSRWQVLLENDTRYWDSVEGRLNWLGIVKEHNSTK